MVENCIVFILKLLLVLFIIYVFFYYFFFTHYYYVIFIIINERFTNVTNLHQTLCYRSFTIIYDFDILGLRI